MFGIGDKAVTGSRGTVGTVIVIPAIGVFQDLRVQVVRSTLDESTWKLLNELIMVHQRHCIHKIVSTTNR